MPAAIRVLYVDDEPLLLEIAKRYLEKSGDFSVTTIGSASAALDMLKLEQFDAVISDYQMPDIDGLEFLQQVRHIYGQVPFILFTGRGREEVVILALNNGADFYLQKGGAPQPQFAELAHKIRQAVQRRKADIALLESERRYRDIVETQTEFISRFKPDGTHVFVNEAYCRHFGKRRDDVVGHRFLPAIPHEDLELVRRHFASLTRDHPVADLEHRVMMSDGSIRWHWWNDLAIFDEESNVVEYQSLGKDITDRKRAEESLLQERGFTDAVLESVPGLLYLYDGDGRLLRWNKGHETLTGYTPAELAGMHVLDWFRHSDVQTAIIRDGIERTFRDGHADVEADLMVKSGKLIPYFFTATLLEIQDRKYFTGIGIDMTPRKEAEKGLRESEEKFRVMAETAPVAIVVYQDTRMVYVNDYTARMTGYSRKELYDMDFWDMYHPDFQEPIKERGLARLRGEEVRPDLEIKYITKSGEIRWGFLSAGGITYGGKPAGVATLVDITDRKRTGDELRASYEQLAAAEEELRAQFCALKEVQQQIQQSELDYRSILENMQDVYYRSDDRGNLILASPSLATLLGYASVSELYGKRIAQVLYYQPEVRELVIADIQKEGSVNNYEVTLKKQDGTPVIVSTSSHEYFDADGNYRGIEGIFRDITERKDAEETLKKSENLYRTI
ncbi:MAG: PAS domain S-box protein, partial [Methanomicrobiales archaeon]|nr:PAS domain S-box protein [Methanomicrobiales archaeon]